MYTVVIVEDDPMITELNRRYAERDGRFTVAQTFVQPRRALDWLRHNAADLIILDFYMPQMNGLEFLRSIRAAGIESDVIMITAANDAATVEALTRLGVVDYLVKPFAFEELLARIHSIMRRPGKWGDLNLLKLGDIAFDPECGRLTKGAKECTLSGRESALLEVFLRNPGQVLPRNLLLSRVWGMESDVEEGNLDNYIHFLRRRLKSVESTLVLKTIRGIGYQLEVCQ